MRFLIVLNIFMAMILGVSASHANPEVWQKEWPKTDFSKSRINFEDVLSGGPPKDGIPSIDKPVFIDVQDVTGLQDQEGVIRVEHNGVVKAYPLRILMWHEIVNDDVGGKPLTITYCPLCNAAIVFERTRPDGKVLDFGTTGKLRNSDLIMYDRQTQSWWQQFTGEAIIGELSGQTLGVHPSRVVSWVQFKEEVKRAKVLVPNDPGMRDYGRNPYVGYSKRAYPFLYSGAYPDDIAPMAPVVIVEDKAWSLSYLKRVKQVETGGLLIQWQPGLSSALETATVFGGEDVGMVTVTRSGQGVAFHHSFAFAFRAFYPQGVIVQN